jgi:hypothetical protein
MGPVDAPDEPATRPNTQEDVMNIRGSAVRGGITAAVVTAAALVAVPAAPAQAAGKASCSIGLRAYSCSTGTVTPTSDHRIGISAMSRSVLGRSVTCRAHDAGNGIQVGSVTANTPFFRETKAISGLYGSYFVVCVTAYDGTGEGSISG